MNVWQNFVAGLLCLALLFSFIPSASAQELSWENIGDSFDAMGLFTSMLGPISNLVIDQRPIAWTATVAGVTMNGHGGIYLTTHPPDMDRIAERLPLLQGFNLFQNDEDDEERTDLFVIELVHPFLTGSNGFNGAFAGEAGPRTIGIPNWLPYEEGSTTDYPDRSYLDLNFAATSPLGIRGRSPEESRSYALYGDQGSMTVHEVDRGFYATVRALLKPSVPPLDEPPFKEAVINMRLCEVAPEDAGGVYGEVPCLFGDIFQVVEQGPEPERENVDYKNPSIRVTFSDTLSRASLTDNVDVFTMSREGEELYVSGTVQPVGSDAFTFVPDEPLLDGVIYEVRVRGGEEGVRSVNRDVLPDDVTWRFSTVIDIEKRFDSDDFYGVVDENFPADGPVQSFVYQTSRDAPLIAGKPTLTRIYVHWKAYDHIASDWQPTSFRAEVTVEDSHDGSVYTHLNRPYRIERPDQFTDADRRFARNTVNLFNWRPLQAAGGTTLTVTVEPEDVYPEPNEDYLFEEEKFIGRWPHAPKHLVFDYFTLPLGDWVDGIPAEDERLARQISRATEVHLTQLFPIGSARSRDMGMLVGNFGDLRTVSELIGDGVFAAAETGGTIAYGGMHLLGKYSFTESGRDWWLEKAEGVEHFAASAAAGTGEDLRRGEAIKRMMQRIHNVHGPRTNADVLVGYIPLSFYGAGQALSSIDYDWSTYDEVPGSVDFFRRSAYLPVWPEGPYTMGLSHEIGHTYHLHHEPPSETPEQRAAVASQWTTGRWPGIHGFRIAPSGAFGWNKSSWEGNAEDASTLLSFMFPVSRMHTETFISQNHYDSLLTTFLNEAQRRTGFLNAPSSVQVASLDPFSVPLFPGERTNGNVMLIAGYIHKEAPVIYIDAVRRRVEYTRNMEAGPYAAVLVDESGRPLARQPFGEYIVPGFAADDDEWIYFQVYLPEDDEAHRIELWEGDVLLTAWERPDIRPEVRFTSAGHEGETLRISGSESATIEWEGNDEHLVYSLYYSPDGSFPWTTLVMDTTDVSVRIDPRTLEPGSTPTLRLVAGNGFDEAEATVPVVLERNLTPIWLNLQQGDQTGPMLDVEVTFSSDLNAASIDGKMLLKNLDGEEIAASVVYDERVRVLRLTPLEPLARGLYTVTLRPGIADRYGNTMGREAKMIFIVDARAEDGIAAYSPPTE